MVNSRNYKTLEEANKSEDSRQFSIREVSERMGVAIQTVHNWLEAGKLQAFQVELPSGTLVSTYITYSDLQDFIGHFACSVIFGGTKEQSEAVAAVNETSQILFEIEQEIHKARKKLIPNETTWFKEHHDEMVHGAMIGADISQVRDVLVDLRSLADDLEKSLTMNRELERAWNHYGQRALRAAILSNRTTEKEVADTLEATRVRTRARLLRLKDQEGGK
jgi:soluble cytochrome b562